MMVLSPSGHSLFMLISVCCMDHGNFLNFCLIFVSYISRSVQDYFHDKDLYVCYGAVICVW